MRDVLIHAAVAVVATAIAALLGHWLFGAAVPAAWIATGIGLVAWPLREILQAKEKYGRWVLPGDRDWSRTKTREAVAPMLAHLGVAMVLTLVL
jgi:hypothetical protein